VNEAVPLISHIVIVAGAVTDPGMAFKTGTGGAVTSIFMGAVFSVQFTPFKVLVVTLLK